MWPTVLASHDRFAEYVHTPGSDGLGKIADGSLFPSTPPTCVILAAIPIAPIALTAEPELRLGLWGLVWDSWDSGCRLERRRVPGCWNRFPSPTSTRSNVVIGTIVLVVYSEL